MFCVLLASEALSIFLSFLKVTGISAQGTLLLLPVSIFARAHHPSHCAVIAVLPHLTFNPTHLPVTP